jgi:SAM-dependent methyltransferase
MDKSNKNQNIWAKVFDIEYSKMPITSFTLNTDVWKKNEDKKPFSKEEMEEWLNNTYSKLDWILSPEMNVLEIGCGNGLISKYLVSRCKNYTGIDPSKNAIDKLKSLYENVKTMQFYVGDALNFPIKNENYHLIIINSVIQYYPDIRYAVDSIRLALANLHQSGAIFIGDVRSLPHSWCYEKDICKSFPTNNIKHMNFLDQVEKELLFHSYFFKMLPNYLNGISSVYIDLKRGKLVNELSRYRYDVFIFKDKFNNLTTVNNDIFFNNKIFLNSRLISERNFPKQIFHNEIEIGKNLLSEKFDGSKFIDFAVEHGLYYITVNNFEEVGAENIFNFSNKICQLKNDYINSIFK